LKTTNSAIARKNFSSLKILKMAQKSQHCYHQIIALPFMPIANINCKLPSSLFVVSCHKSLQPYVLLLGQGFATFCYSFQQLPKY